jgi:hypothetical protein
MLIEAILAAGVVFTGNLILVESKTDPSKSSVVIAPTHMDHHPTLLIDADALLSWDPRTSCLSLTAAWIPDLGGGPTVSGYASSWTRVGRSGSARLRKPPTS